jgi:VanZ family protein
MKYATLIVSVLIVIAVLIPGPDLPDVDIGGFDKLIHMAMFGAWALAVRYDFNRTPFPLFGFFATGILFSGLTEVLQLLVEGRTFDLYDMAADAVGLLAGFAIGAPLIRWWRNRGT